MKERKGFAWDCWMIDIPKQPIETARLTQDSQASTLCLQSLNQPVNRQTHRFVSPKISEVLVGQIGQFTALPFVEGDMGEQLAPFEPIDHITHAIGLLIQVWRVDLPNISSEDDL